MQASPPNIYERNYTHGKQPAQRPWGGFALLAYRPASRLLWLGQNERKENNKQLGQSNRSLEDILAYRSLKDIGFYS